MSDERPVDDALTVIEKFAKLMGWDSERFEPHGDTPETVQVIRDDSNDWLRPEWIGTDEAAGFAAAYCWKRGWRPLTTDDHAMSKRIAERFPDLRRVAMARGQQPDAYLNEHLVRLTVMQAELYPEEQEST